VYVEKPVKTMLSNSLGTLNVLEASRKGENIVLCTSTLKVYGDAEAIPTITLYYAYFINQTVLAGGWRISQAKPEWTNGEGISFYKADVALKNPPELVDRRGRPYIITGAREEVLEHALKVLVLLQLL